MAKFLLPLFISFLLAIITITESKFYSTTKKSRFPGKNPTKLTHLNFYFHDIVSGKTPTAIRVAAGPETNVSSSFFGFVAVVDDPLTEGPNITSKEVGRAQGMYVSADQKNIGLLMEFNLVFTSGKFAGSSLAMHGRNPVMSAVREMPIIGGTGEFRFGRGYAEAKTFVFNMTSGDAVVEYNVYVWHF